MKVHETVVYRIILFLNASLWFDCRRSQIAQFDFRSERHKARLKVRPNSIQVSQGNTSMKDALRRPYGVFDIVNEIVFVIWYYSQRIFNNQINHRAVISYTGGLIPSGGPPERTWEGNIILVGDAAGQTHPITGAGVAHACLCGQLAGKAAARAALCGDLSLLGEYEQEWRDLLGGILAHALARRRDLDKSWSDDPVALAHVLYENWVAFPAYGRHRRADD